MKKIALILVTVILASLAITPFSGFANGKIDPYTGFGAASFDETTYPSCNTSGGFLGASGSNQTYTYHNVDFGDYPPLSVTIEIGAPEAYSGGTVTLYADDTKTPIASVVVEASDWNTPLAHTCDITANITGVHTVLLKTGSSTNNFFNIRFRQKASLENAYIEYDASADRYTDIAKSPYRQDINMLYDMGFFTVDEDEEALYYPNLPVKRSRFAGIIAALAGGAPEGLGAAIFSDVSEDDPYGDAIGYISGLGYVSGFGDGTFRPDEFIRVDDAVTIICRMLGYHAYAQQHGGYTNGYLFMAKKQNILDGLNSGEYLTGDGMARLILNAINADYYTESTVYNNGGMFGYEVVPEGVLSRTMNIYHSSGLVSANNITGVSMSGNEFPDNRVIINDETFFVGESSARSLLGYECKYYYQNLDGVKTILAIAPENNAEITEAASSDFDIEKITVDEVIYYGKKDDDEHTIDVASDAHIIYNGVAIEGALSSLITMPFKGKIKYVDNPRAKDTLFIDEYINIIIGSFSKSDGMIYDELGNDKYVLKDADAFVYFTKGGLPSSYADVEQGDVAMLYLSKNTKGKRLARIVISDETVSGTISKIGDLGLEINGKWYELASECNPADYPIGLSTTFNLNTYGEIVCFGDMDAGDKKVAWLINCGDTSKSDLNRSYKIKVLDTDNIINVYELADACWVDGQRYKNNSATISSAACDAPIRYVLNSDNKVTEIDTVASDELNDRDVIEQVGPASATFYWDGGTRMFQQSTGLNAFIFNKDGLVLCKWTDALTPEDYTWETTSAIGSEGRSGYAYSFDFSKGCADIFVLTNPKKTYQASFVVDMIATEMNDKGEICDKIVGTTGGKTVEYLVSGKYPEVTAKTKNLERGDYIRVSLDRQSEVSGISIIFLNGGAEKLQYTYNGSLQEETAVIHNGKNVGYIEAVYLNRFVYGKVTERNGQYVKLSYTADGTEEYVHLGSVMGIEKVIRSSGEFVLADNITPDKISVGDEIIIGMKDQATSCIYILKTAGGTQ